MQRAISTHVGAKQTEEALPEGPDLDGVAHLEAAVGDEAQVYQHLSTDANKYADSQLLSILKPVEEVAGLKKYFSDLAIAASNAEVGKDEGVRSLLHGVYRLTELAYECFPSCEKPNNMEKTEEKFVKRHLETVIADPCKDDDTGYGVVMTMAMAFVNAYVIKGIAKIRTDLSEI
ncbi:hypothetical protein BRADI_1g19095v3 [Brachypodium distachyon]|uniref:Uncharacterized protein n=1 Tax=Brachypodium distachyon TaxID=15368 RepID=A0A2K2DK33_BRADI|nr:hypothetical protein BRADI_1g19095v3 [Brachypodium distachyon]